jgi:hypothetical protein
MYPLTLYVYVYPYYTWLHSYLRLEVTPTVYYLPVQQITINAPPGVGTRLDVYI